MSGSRGLGDVLAGWRLALRVGRREARRAKWRSLLVIAMIALPVAGVVSVAVTYKTYDVNTAEGLDRRLGTEAAARVVAQAPGAIRQGIDPDQTVEWLEDEAQGHDLLDEAGLTSVLGDRPVLEIEDRNLDVRTDKGATWASALRVDLTDPLASGLTRLTDGRYPDAAGEVVVNDALAGRGPGLGEKLEVRDAGAPKTYEVVGVVEAASTREEPFVAGTGLPAESAPHGSMGSMGATWLVGGDPVTWSDIEALNAKGALALSRSVVANPSATALAADRDLSTGSPTPDPAGAVIVVLIVVMVILEVVLLAGPAFAVAARRQARDLALISASGGTARQARRVVLGMAVVLGAVAAVVGSVLGVVLARLLQPLAQAQVSDWFGPFEVPWLQILAVAAIGFAAAICAAVVPAWIASRQNVVGVLSGRRAESRPSRRSPVIGIVLLAAGVASSVLGTKGSFSGVPIALGVLLCVLGVLFILPVLIAGVARLSAGLPLVIRFATRDADRHRTRTVPAAGAIAVTVVGVVILGIAIGSDQKQNEESYQPSFAIGDAQVQQRHGDGSGATAARWNEVADQVEKAAPGSTATEISGTVLGRDDSYVEVRTGAGDPVGLNTSSAAYGELLVAGADGALPPVVTRSLPDLDVAGAEKMLRSSGALVFTSDDKLISSRTAQVAVAQYAEGDEEDHVRAEADVAATYIDVGDQAAPAYAVVSAATAKKIGAEVRVMGLYVEDAGLSAAAETDLDEALGAAQLSTTIHVERGFEEDDATVIVWLLLITLGSVLMLGGALTATHLALNDARPDLATLSAVGARTRTRRGVAAAYAVVVTLLGAIPGAIIGFVPGIAISYPLTAEGWPTRDDVASHYLVVPWGLVGLVMIGLPLLIALVVAVTTRSRLPMVARVE